MTGTIFFIEESKKQQKTRIKPSFSDLWYEAQNQKRRSLMDFFIGQVASSPNLHKPQTAGEPKKGSENEISNYFVVSSPLTL